jgi:biopolymer transport protein ExbD
MRSPCLIELWMDGQGRFALGDQVMPFDTLIRDLGVRLEVTPETRVLLTADDEVPATRLRELMQALRGLGIGQLLIVARQGSGAN